MSSYETQPPSSRATRPSDLHRRTRLSIRRFGVRVPGGPPLAIESRSGPKAIRRLYLHKRARHVSSLSFGSPRGHQAIRWSKNRYAEDRLDLSAISDPDLGHHRPHHGLALRQLSITQGPLDLPDEFSEFRGVRNGRLTVRYLLGKFRAPGLERRQLRREFLDVAQH